MTTPLDVYAPWASCVLLAVWLVVKLSKDGRAAR